MVALDFTDEIVYKNAYSVYIFIGALTPAQSAITECRIRLLPGCDNLEGVVSQS
jgi:hypothetical protein